MLNRFKISLLLIYVMNPFIVAGQNRMSLFSTMNESIVLLRDSLNAIQYPLIDMPINKGKWTVVKVKKQVDWDSIVSTIKILLDAGEKNLLIKIIGKDIEFGFESKVVQGLTFPDANIRIIGNKARLIPYGYTFSRNNARVEIEGDFYTFPYSEYNLDNIVIDSKGNEVPVYDSVRQLEGEILRVQDDIWKFKVELPDLAEDRCKDFYVLLTRDWTSARHKVEKVQEGWLFFHLDSKDLHSERDPNIDWIQYHVRPRYRLINCPVSRGVHIAKGKIFIPIKYKKIRVNKGGQFITFAYCHFNRLEISGFKFNGCGEPTPFGIYSSTFEQGAFIHDNTFTNMSGMAISTAFNTNVIIANNSVTNTRVQAIGGDGTNTTICCNRLKNIGWMLNTRAITGGGEKLHICDNVIEDFNYGAISCGSTNSNDKANPLTYIIERNIIRLTKEYTDNYLLNTLADGGGIYIGPQCTQGIIRDNVVENIKGIHSNRGIFLDDGAKNLAIYGNLIIKTENCYDIDLRLCKTHSVEIPDYNTNNLIFNNLITGGYRFQDNGANSGCVGGQNYLFNLGWNNKTVVELNDSIPDIQMEDCSFQNGKLAIPKDKLKLIDNSIISGFVIQYIVVK